MGEETQIGTEMVWDSMSSSEGALSISEAEENPYFDFISILALAQKLDIDFLPMSWQPALKTVGELPTAEILQALISMQTSLAFKRVKRGWETRSKADKSKVYQCMYSEILALGQPEIRKHPNVVRLEGLCWDILPDNKGVCPVLAFEKAGLGSLTEWSASSEGKTATHSVRLRLCADVANAVRHLHVNHIIHGDIKPDHVLIFRDQSNNLVAKVAGFGNSTMFTSQSTIHMSKSSYWTAPEWHHRGFAPSSAKKMDIYSLGVLSLWLVVYETQDNGTQPFPEFLNSRIHTPWDLKGTALETSGMSDKEKRDLVEFFAATLTLDPFTRTSDLTKCISLLTQKPATPTTSLDLVNEQQAPTICEFHLKPSITQLYDADPSVPSYITACLIDRNTMARLSPSNQARYQNDAFQLALCYALGFGVVEDNREALALLEQIGMQQHDFEKEISAIRDIWDPFFESQD